MTFVCDAKYDPHGGEGQTCSSGLAAQLCTLKYFQLTHINNNLCPTHNWTVIKFQ